MNGLFVIQFYNRRNKDWQWLKSGKYFTELKKNMTPSEKYSFLGSLEPYDNITLALKKLNYYLNLTEAGLYEIISTHKIPSIGSFDFENSLKYRIINIIDNCNVAIELTLSKTPYHYMNSINFSEHLGDQNNVCFDSKYGEEIFKFSCENTKNKSYLGCSLNLDEYKSKIEKFYKKVVNINTLEKH
jgi:hypothetical protein